MQNHSFPKVFIRLLSTFHRNPKATENDLRDRRLNLEEKTILRGWFLLRKNKVAEVIELISSMSISQNELIECQKKLLLGICFNNLGHLNKSQNYLKEVPGVLSLYQIKCLQFIAYYNLFVCYFNLNDIPSSEETIKQMESLRPDHYRHDLLLLQCRFMLSLLNENNFEAQKYLDILDRQTSKMSESMKLGHYYDKFNFYLNQNKLSDCLISLMEMKKCRAFNLSENFIYMKTMLELLVHDKPIYAYSHQFKLNHHYFYHLKVIQLIQSMDIPAANVYWKKLFSYDHENYFDGFKVKDQKSLLALALKKFEKNINTHTTDMKFSSNGMSKEKLLAEILQSSPHPIPKDLIHELIWGRKINDKNDMIKLKKLVSRVRQLFGLDIKFKSNCYYVVIDQAHVA
jgi:hypothetical protein